MPPVEVPATNRVPSDEHAREVQLAPTPNDAQVEPELVEKYIKPPRSAAYNFVPSADDAEACHDPVLGPVDDHVCPELSETHTLPDVVDVATIFAPSADDAIDVQAAATSLWYHVWP
jgi:hypothetical protein